MTTRHLRLAGLAALLLAACGGGSLRAPPEQPAIDRRPIVRNVASCEELEGAIEDAVVAAMTADLEGGRSAIWTIGDGAAGAPAPGAAAGPEHVTTTNSQVAGVAEADFVQNDGTRITVLARGGLQLLRSWPADALALAATLPLEGWPREHLLAGDRALVFSSIHVPRPGFDGASPPCLADRSAAYCGFWGNNATKLTLVDVSALDAPRVAAEAILPGRYLSSRRIGDRVRAVLEDDLPYPDGVHLWPPDLAWNADPVTRQRAFDALRATNEALIRGRTLADWLRRGRLARPDGSSIDLAYACEDFAVSTAPSRPGIVSVATLDLAAGRLVSHTSLLARADVVYATADTLVLAAAHWWWWPEPGQHAATYLHAFDLGDPDRAGYLGSGVVDGTVSSQYQLDAHAGHLRVASTLVARVEDGTPWGALKTAGQITVVGLDGGALREVGRTAPFGADERVFGTRFLGARGFAITARQIDPLFTFDLADPAAPRKVGEVEMPGFISYLHPVDDGHLLGVGREPAGASGPMQVKVQLLDVADLAHPAAGAPALVGEGWSWSEALWDPKAFTWLGARGVLAIPFVDYGASAFVSDLRLFRVDPAAGVAPLGSLSMADVYGGQYGWDAFWSPSVRRGILADGFVYAVSDAGVRAASVAGLPAWLATVRFPPTASTP